MIKRASLVEQKAVPIRLGGDVFPQINSNAEQGRYSYFHPGAHIAAGSDAAALLRSRRLRQHKIAQLKTACDEGSCLGSFLVGPEIVQEVVAALVDGRSSAGTISEDQPGVVAQIRSIVRVLDFMTDMASGIETEPQTDTEAVEKQNIGRLPIRRRRPQLMTRQNRRASAEP